MSLFGADDEAPGWLKTAVAATLPAYGPKVPAVVLLNERSITLDERGAMVTVVRFAMKVLTREGSRYAGASEYYTTGGGGVPGFNVWLIYPSGNVKRFKKDEIMDLAAAENDVYNEYRRRAVYASRQADPGAIFGYEAIITQTDVFTQIPFGFQWANLPTITSRLTLTLPPGWTAEGLTFNAAPLQPKTSPGSYNWEMSNLPHIETEDYCPSSDALSPRLAVNIFPTSGIRKAFATWEDVSQWMAGLNESQYEPDAAIRAKAEELARGQASDWDKIKAIGKYVQAVNYVSIQTGLDKGGGYKPHLASTVFAKRYGDCKDKSNLLRSMLKAIGIAAYPVGIYSGDRNFAKAAWPSPFQFNHAISAIQVPDSVQAAAVLVHPKLGRLLLFDPTDPYTPVGFLPGDEQDSYALVVDAAKGGLVKVPAAAADPETWTRQVEAKISAAGAIEGSVKERRQGEASGRLRARYKGLSQDDYRKSMERFITSPVRGAAVMDLVTKDEGEAIEWSAKFAADRYATQPNPTMMVLRSSVLRPPELPRFAEKSRKLPVVLNAEAMQEKVTLLLPDGFKVDEIPDAVRLETPYGRVEATWKAELGSVTFTRKIILNPATVPVVEYTKLKQFLDVLSGSGEEPIVLVKQ